MRGAPGAMRNKNRYRDTTIVRHRFS